MIIAVDFDATLTKDSSSFPEVVDTDLRFDRVKKLKTLQARGIKLILWTCRFGTALEQAVELCKEYGLTFDAVNDNLPEIKKDFSIQLKAGSELSKKIYADRYLDDKALTLEEFDNL